MRRPTRSAGTYVPAGMGSTQTSVWSVIPRRASAAAKSGCAFTSCSQASYSSPMIAACWPSTTRKSSRRSSLSETVASHVVSATQSTSTIAAVRSTAAPGACAASVALSGSTSAIEMTSVRSLSGVLAAQRSPSPPPSPPRTGDRADGAGWDQACPGSNQCPVQMSRTPRAAECGLDRDMQHDELRRCENRRVNETRDVVVVGATGKLGEQVCHRLRAQGEQVRALVRGTSDPATRARLEADGVRCFEGDIEQPETLGAVFAGAGVVVSTASAFPMRSAARLHRARRRGGATRGRRGRRGRGRRAGRLRVVPAGLAGPPVPARQARGRGAPALGPARARDPASREVHGRVVHEAARLRPRRLGDAVRRRRRRAGVGRGGGRRRRSRCRPCATPGSRTRRFPSAAPRRIRSARSSRSTSRLLGRPIATEVMPRSALESMLAGAQLADRGVARRRPARGDRAERPGMARASTRSLTSDARRSQISRLPTPTRRAVDDPSLRHLYRVPE